MGLFSKLRKKVKAKKVAKKIISPKIAKSGRGGILNEIRERGGFAGAIPMPIRPRLGFGLGELLPRIKDKVPLAPVFSGMPMPQMVGQPQMLPQPISRVPVEENISEISTPGFAMRDVQMDMMQPRMMMADGEEADMEDFIEENMKKNAINSIFAESGINISNQDKNVIMNSVLEQTKGRSLSNQDIQMIINMIPKRSGRTISNQDRVMMADGDVALSGEAAAESLDSFLNSDPEQVAFGRQVGGALAYDDGVIQITEKELDDYSRNYLARNGEMAAALGLTVDDIRAESLDAIRRMKEGPLMEGGKYNPFENPRRVPEFADGGEAKPDFLDFDNDGDKEESMKQALQQKNKFAEGDEVSMMLMEMDEPADMSEEEMEGLEGLSEVSGPETEMLNNIINQIIELIAQGATEEEIIQFLMEQGLDEEDITEVMSMLSQEMTAGGEEGIDSQLAALG